MELVGRPVRSPYKAAGFLSIVWSVEVSKYQAVPISPAPPPQTTHEVEQTRWNSCS